jgi:hypothetical protein
MGIANPNPKPEVMAIPTPFRNQPLDRGPHLHSHRYCYSRWVVTRKRIVEQDQKTIAGKTFLQCPQTCQLGPQARVVIFLKFTQRVTRGLDPGLTRGSIFLRKSFLRRRWIARSSPP